MERSERIRSPIIAIGPTADQASRRDSRGGEPVDGLCFVAVFEDTERPSERSCLALPEHPPGREVSGGLRVCRVPRPIAAAFRQHPMGRSLAPIEQAYVDERRRGSRTDAL